MAPANSPHFGDSLPSSAIARIRTEGKLIDSIRVGKFDSKTGKCVSGSLGTWGSAVPFVLKDKLAIVLYEKLGRLDRREQDYVFQYCLSVIADFPKPPPLVILRLKAGLKAGDARFRDAASMLLLGDQDRKWAALKEALDAFAEAGDGDEGITDDDVPF
jgi:hypothetical protein